MASLILQDTFQPYYAGRDGEVEARATPRAPAAMPRDRGSREVIRLPSDAPAYVSDARRDRLPVAH